jgi:2-polyprenyl-3-methyl-5-hydroxy-6-metoxy-1,4-benzoquinol methylase
MDRREEIANWYDKWHKERGMASWRPPWVYSSFVEFLGPNPWGKLLDVGCGTGGMLLVASELGLETYGLDISKEAVKLASETSPASFLVTGSMEDISEKNDYRYITALGSFEHCLDMDKALKAICNALMPGGLFIVMVPNSEYESDTKMSVQDEIQETRKTMEEWVKMFESNGLVIRRITHDPHMPVPTKLSKTYQFVFVLEKIDD